MDGGAWGLCGCPLPEEIPAPCLAVEHLQGLGSSPHISILLLQKGGHPLTRGWRHNLSPPFHTLCSLKPLSAPDPLDSEEVFKGLKEKKEKLEEVSGSLVTAELPHGCPPKVGGTGA